jgi:thiamine-monophosphate kinase
MGGEPTGIVFTAGLPEGCSEADLVSIVDGIERACRVYGMRLFGGDTVLSPSGYFFDAAIIGSLPEGAEAFRRSGARPGDLLVLFGEVGGSLAGLKLLESLSAGISAGPLESVLPPPVLRDEMMESATAISVESTQADIEAECASRLLPGESVEALIMIQRHLAPLSIKPPVIGSPEWAAAVRAMIDISDGLGKDLASLCVESDVGAVIDESRIPVPPALAGALEGDRLGLTKIAVSSGEEYVALAAVERETVPPGATVIGEVTGEAGVLLIGDGEGNLRNLPAAGYEHEF